MRTTLFIAAGLLSTLSWAAEEAGKKDAPAQAKAAAAEPAAMQKKTSFEFVDTPFAEVVAFLQNLTQTNFILDPKLAAANPPAVTLKAQEITLREALDRVAQAGQARAYWKDGAYFISRTPPAEEKAAPASPPVPLTEEQRRMMEQAIRELGSEDYATREAASARITKLGRAAVPLLEAALKAEQKDAERQARLTKLTGDLGEGGEPGAALAAALERKVTFCFEDTPASDVAQFLGSLCRGARVVVDPALANTPVSLRVQDMPLKQALDWIARLMGAKVIRSGNTVRLAPQEKR